MTKSWRGITSTETKRISRPPVRKPGLRITAPLAVALLGVVLLGVAALGLSSQADAQEPTTEQHHFYAKEGDFTVDGAAMLAGTVVIAWYDGEEVGRATIDRDGNWELRISAAEYPNACRFRFSVTGHSALKVWSMCSQRVVLEYQTDDNEGSDDPDESDLSDSPKETEDPDDEPSGAPIDTDDTDDPDDEPTGDPIDTDGKEAELEEDDAVVEIVTPRTPETGSGGLLRGNRFPFAWTILTALGIGGLLLAAVRLRR